MSDKLFLTYFHLALALYNCNSELIFQQLQNNLDCCRKGCSFVGTQLLPSPAKAFPHRTLHTPCLDQTQGGVPLSKAARLSPVSLPAFFLPDATVL